MPRPKPASPHPGRAVLSFTAAGQSWVVSTPLLDTTARSTSAALADLLPDLCRKTADELYPTKK